MNVNSIFDFGDLRFGQKIKVIIKYKRKRNIYIISKNIFSLFWLTGMKLMEKRINTILAEESYQNHFLSQSRGCSQDF